MTLGGAVLAGGQSRRMGRDKAFIEINGRPLLQVAVDALTSAGADPIIVVGGDDDGISRLGLQHVADLWPGEGPLGAIITALNAVEADLVAVLSCDLIAASPLAVRTVAGAIGTSDVAVPVVEGRSQWLHSVWRRSSQKHLDTAFAAGIRAPRLAVEGLAITHVLDGDPCWYHDADRPEDLPARGLRSESIQEDS